ALRRWAATVAADAGSGVRIALVDCGVDRRHADLAHVDCRAPDHLAAPADGVPHPHANHVAGIIGARGERFHGLAPAAELHSIRVTPLGDKVC
ncbi:S8 family serine peptidase, partial [Acinetobacter baumannii]